MTKRLISVKLDEKLFLDIERLKNNKRFSNRTNVIEEALEKGLKILKEDNFSKI